MDELKEKLKSGKLTRAELNAAQPSDDSTLEWKAWNDLRIAMNDMLAGRVEAIEISLVTRRADVDKKFEVINEALKEIREIVLNTRDNHLHDIKEALAEFKVIIDGYGGN